MPTVDAMIARLESELEERNHFVEGLVAGAQDGNRDLNSQEMELIGSARQRITAIGDQLTPLRETSRITIESRNRMHEIDTEMQGQRRRAAGPPIEYRSAGAYVAEQYYAMIGDGEAAERLEVFNRAAAHQKTSDNPGLLPESVVAPVLNFVDAARPLVGVIGPVDLGSGSWSYAQVTQHTSVGVQPGEKTELASQQMKVTKTPLSQLTYGGYVNVSKQDINRSSPAILDMIINDLASQYAIVTEEATGTPARGLGHGGADTPGHAERGRCGRGHMGRRGCGLRRDQGAGAHGRRRLARHARRHRADLPRRQPVQRLQQRVRGGRVRPGRPGHHLGRRRRHVRWARPRQHRRVLDRRGQVLRVQVRQPASRRALGLGRAGRLRRGLRRHRHRARGHHQGDGGADGRELRRPEPRGRGPRPHLDRAPDGRRGRGAKAPKAKAPKAPEPEPTPAPSEDAAPGAT